MVRVKDGWKLLCFGICAAAVVTLAGVTGASAQAWWDSIEIGQPPEIQHGFLPEPSIATSLPHNGDPTGFRKWLGQRGVVYGLEYTNDVLANVHGGLRTRTIDQVTQMTAVIP